MTLRTVVARVPGQQHRTWRPVQHCEILWWQRNWKARTRVLYETCTKMADHFLIIKIHASFKGKGAEETRKEKSGWDGGWWRNQTGSLRGCFRVWILKKKKLSQGLKERGAGLSKICCHETSQNVSTEIMTWLNSQQKVIRAVGSILSVHPKLISVCPAEYSGKWKH